MRSRAGPKSDSMQASFVSAASSCVGPNGEPGWDSDDRVYMFRVCGLGLRVQDCGIRRSEFEA